MSGPSTDGRPAVALRRLPEGGSNVMCLTHTEQIEAAIGRLTDRLRGGSNGTQDVDADLELIAVAARAGAAAVAATLDARRYDYLLDCEIHSAVKYLPNLDPLEFKAARRLKHDRDMGEFYGPRDPSGLLEPAVAAYDATPERRQVVLRWPDGEVLDYQRSTRP